MYYVFVQYMQTSHNLELSEVGAVGTFFCRFVQLILPFARRVVSSRIMFRLVLLSASHLPEGWGVLFLGFLIYFCFPPVALP